MLDLSFIKRIISVYNRKGVATLSASLASRRREMKSWGIRFTDGAQKRLVTAQEARAMRLKGLQPGAGAVLTPLAKEILEGTD